MTVNKGWGQHKQGLSKTGLRNHGTSVNNSSHVESGWRLNELTEGVVKIEVGSLFQNFTIRIKKDGILRRCRLGPCKTLKGWPFKPCLTGGKIRDWHPDPTLQKHTGCGYEVSYGFLRNAETAGVVALQMAVGGSPL